MPVLLLCSGMRFVEGRWSTKGLACELRTRDSHELHMALNSVVARNLHAISKGSSAWSMAAALYIVMGVVFGIWGWTSELHPITVLGVAFFVYGVFTAIRGRRIVRAG